LLAACGSSARSGAGAVVLDSGAFGKSSANGLAWEPGSLPGSPGEPPRELRPSRLANRPDQVDQSIRPDPENTVGPDRFACRSGLLDQTKVSVGLVSLDQSTCHA
jgi:hypothetical protein